MEGPRPRHGHGRSSVTGATIEPAPPRMKPSVLPRGLLRARRGGRGGLRDLLARGPKQMSGPPATETGTTYIGGLLWPMNGRVGPDGCRPHVQPWSRTLAEDLNRVRSGPIRPRTGRTSPGTHVAPFLGPCALGLALGLGPGPPATPPPRAAAARKAGSRPSRSTRRRSGHRAGRSPRSVALCRPRRRPDRGTRRPKRTGAGSDPPRGR